MSKWVWPDHCSKWTALRWLTRKSCSSITTEAEKDNIATSDCMVQLCIYGIEYEKKDQFAVKLIIQYKQLKISKHYLLYINPIFQISIILARKVSFLC